jgi:hypothetical protein
MAEEEGAVGRMQVSGSGLFECLPDWLIENGVLVWLVARSVLHTDMDPCVYQIRDVLSFGATCRRMHAIAGGARAVWGTVDFGYVIDDLA